MMDRWMSMLIMKILVFAVLVTFVTSTKQNARKKRTWVVDSLSMEEENAGPFPYKLGDLNIEKKIIREYIIHGQGIDEDPKGILTIDRTEGSVYVNGKVDYEKHKSLTITFETNGKSKIDSNKFAVDIVILDVNDHAPVFNKPVYEITIDESTPQGEDLVTVMATDDDQVGTANSWVTFRIVSVTPSPSNAEFFIQQTGGDKTGKISFKGCLDYEEAQKYTILVEAKDYGEQLQLSSTGTVIVNVIDKNNHLPEFNGKTGFVKVRKGKLGEPVYRLQVTDKDSRGSAAWIAKYSIQGEKADHFMIETDPDTNDGVITVIESLNYEERSNLSLTVSVENEDLFFNCRVKERLSEGLWDIESFRGKSSFTTVSLPVIVEDVNEASLFMETIKHVYVMENVKIGHNLWTFRAVDQLDSDEIVFILGKDVGGWISVDSQTGLVSTAKVLDRESPLVKDDTYTVVIYAVDKGMPSMTSTGTLIIHLRDENDNSPVVKVEKLSMCLSEKATNITAIDPDLHTYGAPFHFQLMGNVKGKWKLDSTYGTTVRLIKEENVFLGDHKLTVMISDSQGKYSHQNILVRVCDCDITADCNETRAPIIKLNTFAIAALTISLIILLGILLMACKIRNGVQKKGSKPLEGSVQSLIHYNTEGPGTDCTIEDIILMKSSSEMAQIYISRHY
nr:cadherin-like protein 26 [Misgurnus anguillicaudatus]